jgi:hypothetical protein
MFESVNVLAVIVTALLATAVGSMWYSPFMFGTIWMRAIGRTETGLVPTQKEMIVAVAKGFLTYLVFFFSIAQFIAMGVIGIIPVLTFAGLLLLLVATHIANVVIWEGRPPSYFLVNLGYSAVTIFGGVSIITFWPW